MKHVLFAALLSTAIAGGVAYGEPVSSEAAAPTADRPVPDDRGPTAMRPHEMSATMTRAEAAARATQEFDRLDANHDGLLSTDELAAMLPGGRMSGMMARRADANGDGKIGRDEFVAAALRRFDRADANHDGELTKAERDAERDAHRARMRDRMGGADGPLGAGPDGGTGRGMGDGDRPMGRSDGVPVPPPPDDDGQ